MTSSAINQFLSGEKFKVKFRSQWKKTEFQLGEGKITFCVRKKYKRKYYGVDFSQITSVVYSEESSSILMNFGEDKHLQIKGGRKVLFILYLTIRELSSEAKEQSLSTQKLRDDRNSSLDDSVCIDDFQKEVVIGLGGFGTVYTCIKKDTGVVYAMKELVKDQIRDSDMQRRAMSELEILKRVDSPFIVKLYFAFQTKEKLYMVTDFINGGELYTHLQSEPDFCFTEERSRFYAAEIGIGLQYLHDNDIIYRDLKAENVLIDSKGHVVLTDFGISTIGSESLEPLLGTPQYMAPEIVTGQEINNTVDWWALGILLYEMITGSSPCSSDYMLEIYDFIIRGFITFPIEVSTEAVHAIEQLSCKDRTLRISCLNDLKEMDFFKSLDWESLERRKLTPPYIPKVKDERDISLISSQFLKISFDSQSIAESFNIDSFQGFNYKTEEILTDSP